MNTGATAIFLMAAVLALWWGVRAMGYSDMTTVLLVASIGALTFLCGFGLGWMLS